MRYHKEIVYLLQKLKKKKEKNFFIYGYYIIHEFITKTIKEESIKNQINLISFYNLTRLPKG